jgi:O-antigen ligase
MFPDTLSRYFGFRLTDVGGELYALSCAANSLVDVQIVSGHTNAVCIYSFTLLTNGRSAAAVNSESLTLTIIAPHCPKMTSSGRRCTTLNMLSVLTLHCVILNPRLYVTLPFFANSGDPKRVGPSYA